MRATNHHLQPTATNPKTCSSIATHNPTPTQFQFTTWFQPKIWSQTRPMDQQTHPNYPQNNPPLPLATKWPTTTTTTVIAKLPNNPKPMKPERQPLPTQLSISTATVGLCYHHSQPSHSKCILLREYESRRGDSRERRERLGGETKERRLKREKKKFTKKKRETWNKKPFSYNFLATNITCFLEHFHPGFQKSSILQPQNLLYLSNWSLKFKN